MALAVNRELDRYVDQELRSYPVGATKRIFKGALVGLSSAGYAQPLVAGDAFLGVAYEEADNSAGANGAMSVRVYTQGDFVFTLAGATITSVSRPVFASADDTLQFRGSSNSYVGVAQDVPATGEIILRIDPARRFVKTVTHQVEDLAAGADIAVRAIHAFDAEAWMVAARVVNQSTAAAGINDSNTCVVALATGAGTVVNFTFNTTVVFPNANTMTDLGSLTNTHATTGSVLTLAVTNGVTANPGSFLVEVDYV